MFEQYKKGSFPSKDLKQLAEELRAKGWAIEAVWKKGAKAVDNMEQANSFELSVDGTLILKQLGKAGNVRLSKLNEEQKTEFLQLLKKYKLYTQPDWTLGITLSLVYFVLIIISMLTVRVDLYEVVLPIAMGAMLCFIGIAFMRAKQMIPDGTNVLVWVMGIAAIFLSAPASVLNVPLIQAIYRYGLHKRVMSKTQAAG